MYLMLDNARVREIADAEAKAHLKSNNVTDVRAEPAVDSEGHEALKIIIVIDANAVKNLGGDAVLDTLVSIQDRLQKEGEDRLPIIEYTTQDELDNDGDS